MSLKETTNPAASRRMAYTSMAFAIMALLITALTFFKQAEPLPLAMNAQSPEVSTAMERRKNTHTLRVGYGGFPPYTIVDPNATDPDKHVKGFVVDLVNEIAKHTEPPLKVEWYRVNWATLRADMASNRFDVLTDAVYETIPKAFDYSFTKPFGFFGIGAGLVKKDDNRFNNFLDLNRADIVIALAQGYVTSDYAREHLSKPTFKDVPVDADAFVQMDEVLAGRADIALNDVPTVAQYARAHPNKVKALWLEHPPSTVPAGFMLNTGETDLLRFLNTSIDILQANGTIDKIDERWQSLGHFADFTLRSGAGLK